MTTILIYSLLAWCSLAEAIYYGRTSCNFDGGICDGWRLGNGAQIVDTSTHNFTISGNYTQNGSFVYKQSSEIEQVFLFFPTYYRLCQISYAFTPNMTNLEVVLQSNTDAQFITTTLAEPLIAWSTVNISAPDYTANLTAQFRNFQLWFKAVIADDFSMASEAPMDLPSAADSFCVGLDDVTLTYCLPCNFDVLSESGNLMLTITPAVTVIQLIPLGFVTFTLQASSPICSTQRFVFHLREMSTELQSANVALQQLSDTTANLNVVFSSYSIFTGGAQNFTIHVGAGIEDSNYLGYGEIPMVVNTALLTQPGLISTRVPPDPIYYIPDRLINYQLQAISVLSPSNTLKYEFAGSSPPQLQSGLLAITLTTGLIYGQINEDQLGLLNANSYVNVTINDSANDKLIKLTIPVLLGQIAPVYLDAMDGNITIMLSEATPAPSVIAVICVMDPNNDTVLLRFGQFISGLHIFSLDSSDQTQLVLNDPLDYETRTNYTFTITAAEVSNVNNSRTSTATITIQVTPVNEYPPVISPTDRPVQLVAPDVTVGSVVLQVMAEDHDTGSDGLLNYYINNVMQDGVLISSHPFAINVTTGAITTTELLVEGLYNYTISVLVTDMGSPPMTASWNFDISVVGYLTNLSCDFSIDDCSWETEFHTLNSQSSLLTDYNTGSMTTGGYVLLRGNQIIGGAKIFLTLNDVTTSVINDISFVYQLNGSMSVSLQTTEQILWTSGGNSRVAREIGSWRQVRIYAESLVNERVNLQFIATGSSYDYVAIDDLTVQVQTHCNFDALSNRANFNFDLPSIITIPLNDPTMIPTMLTLTECRNEPLVFTITVLPDYLQSYFTYNDDSVGGAINIQAINDMVASNGTTGEIVVSATITAPDLFEGNRDFTYTDRLTFVMITRQKCVVNDECSFNEGLCQWQTTDPITLTTASAISVASRNAGQLVSGDYSSEQNVSLVMYRTINGSYCRITFYYYATSGIILSVYNPDDLGELWDSSEAGLLPEQWNSVNVHISYSALDPRVNFDLSFRVSGVGLLAIDDVTLHPCIDCETGCRNILCPVGEFYSLFDGCQPCPTGHYCLGGTSSAIPCAAGTFNNAERSTSNSVCRPCPDGSFSTSGSTDCSFNTSITCTPGFYPGITDGVASCLSCQPGSACPNGGIRWSCPSGYYASTTRAVNCTICPAGYKCSSTTSGPVQCEDKQYSLLGEVDCHDCPNGFICNDSVNFPLPQDVMEQPTTTCSEGDSNSMIFIIIIVIIVIIAILIIIIMTCYIIRLRHQLANRKKQGDRIQYAARDSNVVTNSTYQPYAQNPRLNKAGVDLGNFSAFNDGMENETFKDDNEIELSERNTMKLLDDDAQL